MEEILASIRRIIEDSETGRQDAPGRAGADEGREVERFRAELKPVPGPVPAAPQAAADPDGPGHVAFGGFGDPAGGQEAEPEEDDPISDVANDDGTHRPPAAPAVASRPAPLAPAPAGDKAADLTTRAPALGREPAETERRSILSEASGRKVAAAFDELNEALLENRRKSLDQMAEEMLRPMLQEWLDDNLPRLVERLVREEIERIARGA